MCVTKSCLSCSCKVEVRKFVCPSSGHVLRKSQISTPHSSIFNACSQKLYHLQMLGSGGKLCSEPQAPSTLPKD